MDQEKSLMELAEEANSLYETAMTKWVEQQPELVAQAKKIMDDVTENFGPEVADVLAKMRSLPWGEFLYWYEKQTHRVKSLTHWYILTRGDNMGLMYNEQKRTWHKNLNKATVYHSVKAAEHVLSSIEGYSVKIAKVLSEGEFLSAKHDLARDVEPSFL